MANPLFNSPAYRAAAAARRARGVHTGTQAKGWSFKRRDPEKGSWDHAVAVARADWNWLQSEAFEQFKLDVYGDPLDGFSY